MATLLCKTVGHSRYDISDFINLIKTHNINCLMDVRSVPYSRYNPQFNREILKTDLNLNDIRYIYMGDCLGARYDDPRVLFPDGQVNFQKVRELIHFQAGIQRVIAGIKEGYMIALMCAEKDPFNCHLFVLVSYELVKNGVQVAHIISEDVVMRQKELEERLLKKYKQNRSQLALFESHKPKRKLLDEAYEMRNKDIAFRSPVPPADRE